MKRGRPERSPLYPKILFGFTEHPITVWAGVILLRLYFEWIKLREELNEALMGFTKHSNNQIGSVDVMLSWFYGLALGAQRFEHFTRYRRDRLLGELLGIERFGSPDTLRRLFLRFGYREVTEVSERLMRFSLARMRPILMGHTLDLDSTILCRYGEQEGSLKGYNPKKPGRPSHHPLVAFLAEGRRLLWATLRSGNSGSANGCVEFLKQSLTVLPDGQRIGLVRADAGYFEKRLYVCVYPFVRSYEWYLLPDEERRDMLKEHGMQARPYPDVRANTVAPSGSATTSGCWPSRPTSCTASSTSCATCAPAAPAGTSARRCRSTPASASRSRNWSPTSSEPLRCAERALRPPQTLSFAGGEPDAHRVDAVAVAGGGLRRVLEEVSQVAVAAPQSTSVRSIP